MEKKSFPKVINYFDTRNQYIIKDGNRLILQSYNTIIAVKEIDKDKIYLDENYYDYSRTTGKYRNKFLGEDKRTTDKKIKQGIYKLMDLNKE